MPRLPVIEVTSDHPSQPVFDVARETWGFVPNTMMTLAHKPEILKAVSELVLAVMVRPGRVDENLKWLIAHISSRAAGCTYCSTHTAYFGPRRSEISDEKLAEAWVFETSPHFDARERAALRVALGAGFSPSAVSDDDFAELRRHFDAEEAVEIMSVISLFGFFNRFNDTVKTELEEPTRATLPDGG